MSVALWPPEQLGYFPQPTNSTREPLPSLDPHSGEVFAILSKLWHLRHNGRLWAQQLRHWRSFNTPFLWAARGPSEISSIKRFTISLKHGSTTLRPRTAKKRRRRAVEIISDEKRKDEDARDETWQWSVFNINITKAHGRMEIANPRGLEKLCSIVKHFNFTTWRVHSARVWQPFFKFFYFPSQAGKTHRSTKRLLESRCDSPR